MCLSFNFLVFKCRPRCPCAAAAKGRRRFCALAAFRSPVSVFACHVHHVHDYDTVPENTPLRRASEMKLFFEGKNPDGSLDFIGRNEFQRTKTTRGPLLFFRYEKKFWVIF